MPRLSLAFLLFASCLVAGCGMGQKPAQPDAVAETPSETLVEARKEFTSKIINRGEAKEPFDTPPAKIFQLVKYPAAVGELGAYLTPDPKDGKQHPAIIWITGGDCNTIGNVWNNPPRNNDQTAAQLRKAGIVMMFPSLRGGNTNPGQREGFYGEIDDVIAARKFLAEQSYVDPKRIYLGGHSTGGTLALLTAEYTNEFRAVFSFGPVDDVAGYGPEFAYYDLRNKQEVMLRSPIHWLHTITSPTFVFEGTDNGNLESLEAMSKATKNAKVKFFPVRGLNHFNVLAPINQLLAEKVIQDTGETCNITITEQDVNEAR